MPSSSGGTGGNGRLAMKRLMLPNLSVHENSFFGNAGCLSRSSAGWLAGGPRPKALNSDFFFLGGGTGMCEGSPSTRCCAECGGLTVAVRPLATLSTARRRWLLRRGCRWYMSSHDRQNTCRLHLSQRTAGLVHPHRSQWEPSRALEPDVPTPLGAPTSFLANMLTTAKHFPAFSCFSNLSGCPSSQKCQVIKGGVGEGQPSGLEDKHGDPLRTTS